MKGGSKMLTRKMMVMMWLGVLAAMGPSAWATHYYVDPSGDDSNGLSWAAAFHTIQQGIDASSATIVEVNEANYYETINFNGVACTVTSTDPNDPNVVGATIIDANGGNFAVTFNSSEGSGSVLAGLTVTGKGPVNCSSASPTIRNCVLCDGIWDGIFSYSAGPTVEGCIIEDNALDGIYAWGSSSLTVRQSVIRGNAYDGIGLIAATATVKNNLIYDNDWAGIACTGSGSPVIRNNTVVKNGTEGIYKSGVAPTITNCIIWDCNDDLYDCNATYSCIQDGDGGTGNISSYPYFEDFDGNDFHLTWNSPCINRGDPNGTYTGEKDIDGEDRVIDGRVDMGADEMNVHNINLVPNSSFELGGGGWPDPNGGEPCDAIPKSWYENNFTSDSSHSLDPCAHSGSYAWKFINNVQYPGYVSYAIPVDPELYYCASAWVRSKTGNEKASLSCRQYDADGDEVRRVNIITSGQAAVPDQWTQLTHLFKPHADACEVRFWSYAPYEGVGKGDLAIWWDDLAINEVGPDFVPPYGSVNEPNIAETIEFGGDEKNTGWIVDMNVMSDPCVDPNDDNIGYRELQASSDLVIKFPAFNIDSNDANGFPLTHMLLEVMFKDTIESSSKYVRVFVESKIDYIDLDPNYLRDPNDRDLRIAHLGELNDNQWKYIQYPFQKSQYQLLRAIDLDGDGKKEFVIKIKTRSGMQLPIDYISLRKITDDEYEALIERQLELRRFYEANLPTDAPASPSYGDPNLVVFCRDIMRPVYRHTKPDPNEPNDVNSFGCWGETEAISFSLYSENGANDINVTVSALTNASDSNYTIDANDMSVYGVIYDEARLSYAFWSSQLKSYALIPDRLEQFATLSVDPNTSERIWVKIRVPEEADGFPAGLYEGQVTIARPNEPNTTIDIDFMIYDVTLDRPEHLNPVYSDPLTRVCSKDLDVVFEAYSETGLDPFVSNTTHRILVGKDPNDANDPIDPNKIVFNTANFEWALDKMVEEGFARDTIIINLGRYYSLPDVYNLVMASNFSESDANLYSHLSDANFTVGFGRLIERYVEICDTKALAVIFTIMDEPGADPFKRIALDRLYTLMKDANYVDPNVDDPDYEVKTTITYYPSCDWELPGWYPEWVTSGAPYYFDLDIYEDDVNENAPDGNLPALTSLVDYKVWSLSYEPNGYSKHQDSSYPGHFGYYTTMHSHFRNPVYNRFLHGLFAVGTDTTIVSAYAMGSLQNDPYNDFDTNPYDTPPFTYPDFIFAYPTWSGELLYTVGGLEGIREGIKDAKYVATLERLIQEDPCDPNTPDANDYLQDVKSRIETDFFTGYYSEDTELGYYDEILADINDSGDPNDFEAFTRIRETIADHIVACSTHYYGIHNTTQDKWYFNINTAIDEANSADVIELSKGTYYENVDYDGKAITIKGKDPNDAAVVAATIISGNGSGNVVAFDSSETSTSVLEGLTIADGNRGIYCYYTSPTISKCVIKDNDTSGTDDGAGMYNDNSDPNVLNCTFSNNDSADDGGGMANYYSDPFVLGCTFSGNTSVGDDGGGMWNYYASPEVNECVFSNNIADSSGGGMFCDRSSATPRILNSVFVGNTAHYGGGMSNWNAVQVTVVNCLFYDNTGHDGGGMFNEDHDDEEAEIVCCTFFDNYAGDDGGAVYHEDSSPIYSSCILWDDQADGSGNEVYNDGGSDPIWEDCDVEGCGGSDDWDSDCGDDDGGNIDEDPSFVGPTDPNGADDTWANCDDGLRLNSNSPCVDEGDDYYLPNDVNTDIKGSDREIGTDVDMGAYEYDSGC
jgi:parallel beta-helix repeat protein